MIHSPPLSMKRVSEKLSMAQRIAAQDEGASSPTPVTMPAAVMAMDFTVKDSGISSRPAADSNFRLLRFLQRFCFTTRFSTLGAPCVHQCLQGRIVSLAQLARAIPSARHSARDHLGDFKHVPAQGHRSAPDNREAREVRLDDQRVAYRVDFLLLVISKVEGHRHLDPRETKCGFALRRKVNEPDILATLQVVHLLVERRALVVALIEIGRQERENIVDPILVVRASVSGARSEE